MPSYELLVVLKSMNKPELVSALKRTAETLWNQGGILWNIQNVGTNKTLPYKISIHGKRHSTGSYFLYTFDAPFHMSDNAMDFFKRDVDIIRPTLLKKDEFKPIECTLEEELKPAAYRKDVHQLLIDGKKHKRQLFKPYKLEIDTKSF